MTPEGFHFADPTWLYFLPLAFLALLLAFFHSRARHSTLSVGNPRLVEWAPSFFSVQLIPWFFRLLAVCLCLIAAARPQSGQKKVEEKMPVTDLYVALDVSGSMVTNDLKPNRITAAKHFLSEFLDKVQNVRMGLTIFARISFTQCPLTNDVGIVKQLLANVEPAPHSIKLDGTAIGDALVSCLNRLQNGTGKGGDQTSSEPSMIAKWLGEKEPSDEPVDNNNQAIILLTDGGNNAGAVDPLTAAKIAASRGVKIYTIGMGAKHSVPALFEYPDGHLAPAIDPRTGQIAMSDPVDMALLTEIARITGAKAYAATDNHAFQAILDEIARLEKRDVSVTTHWEYNELASYFLLAAFLILSLDIGLETTVLRTLP
jgi:Ca-activated chloride channel family protein